MAESQLFCGLESILDSQSLHIELNFHLLLSQPQTARLRSLPRQMVLLKITEGGASQGCFMFHHLSLWNGLPHVWVFLLCEWRPLICGLIIIILAQRM